MSNCAHITAYDESLGHTVCVTCGQVLEENAIVAEVQFAEKASGAAVAEGFSISKDSAHVKSFSKFSNPQISRERVLENGNRRITQIANQLRMPNRQIEAAQRYFNLAVSHSFNKGRKASSVCASCLYIVCRQDKTSHMLIDFADVLQTNVYVLGATFLKLVQTLHLSLPLVDPALYIARFASRLDFGDQTQKVMSDALRLVQRMNRDWMQVGRRPAGICAASLFIAARMNGFERSYREIILVVKICEQTLKKRLEEFKSTPSASLSVNDFGNIWLEQDMDPPSFNTNKTHLAQEADMDKGEESSKTSWYDKELEGEIKDYLADPETLSSLNLLTKDPLVSESLLENDAEFDLSILDQDPEVSQALLTKDEHEFKKFVWEDEYEEYLNLRSEKTKKGADTVPKKKKRRTERPKYSGKNVSEAVGNFMSTKPALSKKINYEILENIFE